MKAFILAAGLGTRLKPFTDKHPKALAKVNGKSLLEWNIRKLQKHGIFDVVVNIHHFPDQIRAEVARHKGFGSRVAFSDETDAVLETGGGLKHAAPLLSGEKNFLVMNVDILSNINLSALIQAHGASDALATLAVQERKSSRYLLWDRNECLAGWENAASGERILPDPGLEPDSLQASAFSGIQVISGALFQHIPFEGKFSIITLYLALCRQFAIRRWMHSDDLLIDAGKPESLAKAAALFKDDHNML